MKIKAHKTNLGTFFKIADPYFSDLEKMQVISINGIPTKDIKKAYSGWYLIEGDIQEVIKSAPVPVKIIGYELTDKKYASAVIPVYIPAEDVTTEWDDNSESRVWTGTYDDLQGFYTTVLSESGITQEVVQFEVEYLDELQIDCYNAPVQMQVTLTGERAYPPLTKEVDLSSVVNYSDIEKMLTPEFLLHERPCTLSSKQVYSIVRSHILANLDGKYARVTSNYDFCFEVKKVVSTPTFTVKKEKLTSRGNSYKPARFENKSENSKLISVFNMTWDKADKGKGYGDYSVIPGWSATSLQAMQEQVKNYLEELMLVINSPAKECEHCRGVGMQFSNAILVERE